MAPGGEAWSGVRGVGEVGDAGVPFVKVMRGTCRGWAPRPGWRVGVPVEGLYRMKKLCFIFGTRPEAVKMAPVILLARRQPERFQTHVCVTGQHRQMLDQMLTVFGIQPDTDLALMRPNQSLADISARTIQAVDGLVRDVRPDWVVVQGDTTTVWAAAVAAFFQGAPVAHIEAGLRTNDRRQPFPEEIKIGRASCRERV